MNELSFTTRYIKSYYPEAQAEQGHIVPQTYGMYWCMLATGMYRIFTKEHLHEFLFRLAIALDSLEVVENWFAYDKLINFTYENIPYSLGKQDVFNHFGFQAMDHYENVTPRREYLNNIGNYLKYAMLLGKLTKKFQVLHPVQKDIDHYLITSEPFTPRITKDLLYKANIFADDLIKLAPEELFDEVTALRKKKMKEIIQRKEKVENLPEFSLDILDEATIEQCMTLMLGDEEVKKLQQAPGKYKKEAHRLIYLAWLFANELAWGDYFDWNMHEGVELNENEYELDDGGINLFETYEDYNMEECAELLKGIGIKEKHLTGVE